MIIFATLIICAVVVALVEKRRRQKMSESKKEAESSAADDLEVKPENVDIGAELGKGNFGTVYKGTLKDSRQV